jgi:hypothetical protein
LDSTCQQNANEAISVTLEGLQTTEIKKPGNLSQETAEQMRPEWLDK